jgi:hypothetical protein
MLKISSLQRAPSDKPRSLPMGQFPSPHLLLQSKESFSNSFKREYVGTCLLEPIPPQPMPHLSREDWYTIPLKRQKRCWVCLMMLSRTYRRKATTWSSITCTTLSSKMNPVQSLLHLRERLRGTPSCLARGAMRFTLQRRKRNTILPKSGSVSPNSYLRVLPREEGS